MQTTVSIVDFLTHTRRIIIMGNRAYVVFDNTRNETPKGSDALPAVYLHWNGGPESVYGFLAYTKKVCRPGDNEYIPARFVQIVGNYFSENLSLGLIAVKREDVGDLTEMIDNGVYVVNVDTFEVTNRYRSEYVDLHAPDGTPYKEGVTHKYVVKSLTKKQIAEEKDTALKHDYHKDGNFEKQISEVNDAFFKKDYKQKVVLKLVSTEKPARKSRADSAVVA